MHLAASSSIFLRHRHFNSRLFTHVITIARAHARYAYPDDNPLSLKSRRIVGRYECDFQNLLWSLSGASMVVYNCSNNSIILSGLRTRLSASFTLKSFTPSFPRPLSPSRFLSSLRPFFSFSLFPSRGLLLTPLAVSSSFYLDSIPSALLRTPPSPFSLSCGA